MRVSTSMMQRLSVESMLSRQAQLSQTQLQLATGKRILTPSQDPSGTTRILSLNQQLSQNDQYQQNIDRLTSRLEAEENVLDSTGNALMRVRELAVSGLNSTYGQVERAHVATEMWLLLDEVFELANSKDGSGEYLFSGYQSQTEPFVDGGAGNYSYQGDQHQRSLKISATREIQSSDTGSEIFENLSVVAGGKQNVFRTIYDFATSLENNTPNSDILIDLDTALESLFSTRAKIGGRLNAIEGQQQINEQFKTQTQAVLSSIQDLDYAEAVGRLNLELAGLQAAQESFQRIQNLSLFNALG